MGIDTLSAKVLYMLNDTLTSNVILITAIGAASNIRRYSQRSSITEKGVVFRIQTNGGLVNEDQVKIVSIRRMTVQLSALHVTSDIEVVNISEYIINALVGKRMLHGGYKTNPIQYDGFMSNPYFDENEKKWRVDLRVLIIVKACS